jgi:hypothetical protein
MHPIKTILIAAVFPAALFAAGTTSGIFAAIEPDPRSAALGGSVAGSVDDSSAIYWNPAGLTRPKGIDLRASHMNWLSLIGCEYFSLASPAGSIGQLGLSFGYFHSGDFIERNITDPLREGAPIHYENFIFSAAFARKLHPLLSVGVAAKYIQQNFYQDFSPSWAFDAGVMAGPVKGVTIGISAANLGPSVSFGGKPDPLDWIARAGGGAELPLKPGFLGLHVSASAEYDAAGVLAGRAGIEPVITLKDGAIRLMPRAGLKASTAGLQLSFGGGLAWKALGFDYALRLTDRFDPVHQFGIAIRPEE